MAKINFRNLLLTGTALVAMSSLSTRAMAVDLVAGGIWGSAAGTDDLSGVNGGDAVDLKGQTLTIINDQTATEADGAGELNAFDVGAITDNDGGGKISILGYEGFALTVSISSIADQADLTIKGNSAADHTGINVTIGAASLGDVIITNNDTGTTHGLTVAFTGGFAAESVTIGTPGPDAGADADVSFGGATINFGSGLELSETASKATVTFDGAAGQTVTGPITAGADGDGEIVVSNSSTGVTFEDAIGSGGSALRKITITDGVTTFEDDVYTKAFATADNVTFEGANIALGTATLDSTATLTFGPAAGATVSGTIDGLSNVDGSIIVDAGSDAVSFMGNIGSDSGLTSIEVQTGTGAFVANVKATNITIDDGATLEINGLVAQTIDAKIDGGADGKGTLYINNDDSSATFLNIVGADNALALIRVGEDIDSTAGAVFEDDVAATDFEIHGDSILTFEADADQLVSGDITGGVGGEGSVVINNTGISSDNTTTFSGAVTQLASIKVEQGLASFEGDVDATDILLGGSMELSGSNNQTVGGDIDGIDDTVNGFGGEIIVNNQDDTKTVIFSDNIGVNWALSQVDIQGGNAEFQGTVRALTLYISDAEGVTTANDTLYTNVIFSDSGSLVLNGDLKADPTVEAGSNPDITGSIDFNGYDGIVTIGDGVLVEGDIDNTDSGNPNAGILDIEGDFTAEGDIGATSGLNYIEAGADGATVEFKGTVNVGELRIYEGGTVTLDKGLSGDLAFTTTDSTGEVQIEEGYQIDGDVVVDSTANGKGTLTFLGSGAMGDDAVGVTGNIGDVDSALSVLNAGVDSTTVGFAGDVYADDINVTGKGTLEFYGDVYGDVNFAGDGTIDFVTGSQTITGNIDADTTDNTGTLVVSGGDLEVDGDIGSAHALKKIDLSGGNLEVSGSVNAKTIAFDVNTLTLSASDSYTLAAGQTLTITYDGDFDDSESHARIVAVGGDIKFDGGTVTITGMSKGDTILIADQDDAYTDTSDFKATLTGGSGVHYAYAVNDDGDIYITAQEISTTTNEGKTWSVVSDAAGDDDDISDLNDAINAASTDEERDAIIQSAMPTLDGSATGIQTSVGVTARVFDIVQTRMNIARADGEAITSMAAGREGNGMTLWGQAYGQHGVQDTKDGIKGYTANTVGGALGLDTSKIIPDGTFGLMFNYGDTSAESENANTTTTDVETYGIGLYAAKNLPNAYFINGQMGYAYNRIEGDRHNVGAPGVTAHGETNNNQYTAKLSVGRDFTGPHGLIVTPTLTTDYAYIDAVGYTETGAGGLNLSIEDSTYQSAKLGIDVNFGWNLKSKTTGASIRPSFHAGYGYDFIGDRIETTAAFSGGGGSFTTTGAEPDKGSITGGLGLTYVSTANWDFSASYDYTYRTTYDAHGGLLKATTRF